ncbi:MAG: type II CAAX endopeptidase family protein [Coriobacteriaceae bacterium]|nr:type II CAAX endopeptidase family protein [Coriobacteriaceae bacterium]
MEKKRIIIYVALAYGLAWALWFAVVYPMVNAGGGLGTSVQFAIAAGMFAPAIAAALTRLITKEGFKDAWIKPRAFKKTWRYYVLAWFGPLVLVIAGAVLYFLINPADFDPSMSYVIQATHEQAEAMGVELAIDDETIRLSQYASLATLVIAPAINAVTCFGEEWGWRGYLLPHLLERFSIIPTLLISGIIWGLWHAPITLIGHNYGLGYAGYPFTGIAAMCLFCIEICVFMSYVTLRTGSCLPAVFAHGMVNGSAAMGLIFSATGGNPFVGPTPTGIVGGAFFIVAAIFMVRDLMRRGWKLPKEDKPAKSSKAAKPKDPKGARA